jgi:DNA-binding protein H-NS
MNEVQELRAKMEQLEADKAALEAALEAGIATNLACTRQAVDDMIRESGFSREEVLGQPDVASDGRSFQRFALRSDPSKTYARGRLPNWLKDAMNHAGANPELAEDRKRFRAEHMVEVA